MTDLLDLNPDEIAEKFEGSEEFAEALVQEKKEEFKEIRMPLSEEETERLYNLYLNSIDEDEIWK